MGFSPLKTWVSCRREASHDSTGHAHLSDRTPQETQHSRTADAPKKTDGNRRLHGMGIQNSPWNSLTEWSKKTDPRHGTPEKRFTASTGGEDVR